MARHRPRPAERRPTRAGHPARLRALRSAGRGDDRQRHHLPRAQRGPRDQQGARLSSGGGRSALEVSARARLPRRFRPPLRATAERGARRRLAARASFGPARRRDRVPAPPPRPAFGRHGDRRGQARRGGAARAGIHAGPRGDPVGQGGLRRPRHHQGRPPRPRHDGRARGSDPAGSPSRRRRARPRAAAARRPRRYTAPCRRPTRSASSRSRAARRWRLSRA